MKAGKANSAAVIYFQQEEWQKSAECHLETGNKILAAEMFEKAEQYAQAADCYRESDFQRNAAQCYVKSKSWRKAADCLNAVYTEEGAKLEVQKYEKWNAHFQQTIPWLYLNTIDQIVIQETQARVLPVELHFPEMHIEKRVEQAGKAEELFSLSIYLHIKFIRNIQV